MISKKIRIGIGIALIIIIIIMSVVVYNNKDKYFINEVIVKYPTGCVEKYVDTKLITDPCEKASPYTNIKWNLNITEPVTE